MNDVEIKNKFNWKNTGSDIISIFDVTDLPIEKVKEYTELPAYELVMRYVEQRDALAALCLTFIIVSNIRHEVKKCETYTDLFVQVLLEGVNIYELIKLLHSKLMVLDKEEREVFGGKFSYVRKEELVREFLNVLFSSKNDNNSKEDK